MIERIAAYHPLEVENQDEALRFYTEKLGLEKRIDGGYGDGNRWLTVAPASEENAEIGLQTPDNLKQHIDLVVDDCQATYDELTERGVEFVSAPEEGYGATQATLKDPDGNVITLTEPPAGDQEESP